MKSSIHFPAWKQALSLVEVMIVVAVLGVLSSLTVVGIASWHQNVKEQKRLFDVDTLNRAITSYLAANGSLAGVETAEEALSKMKTAGDRDSSSRILGASGSFVDARIRPVYYKAGEWKEGMSTVVWDKDSSRFRISQSGEGAIKEFALDATTSSSLPTEKRKAFLALAQKDDWIWDYKDVQAPARVGPTQIPVTAIPVSNPAPAIPTGLGPPPSSGPILNLQTPQFSIPSGRFPFTDFDLAVSIADPNPPGTAQIAYRVDYGNWRVYPGGSFAAPPDSVVEAQALPLDADLYRRSGIAREIYDAGPLQLDPPLIVTDKPAFGLFSDRDVEVSLGDPNDPGTALLEYRVAEGPWTVYSSPFLLFADEHTSGADIEARAVSAGSPDYLPSELAMHYVPVEDLNLSGSTQGNFSNPLGPSKLVSNLSGGATSSYFEWGDGSGVGGSASWSQFAGGSFDDISNGGRFNLGSLTYYNGAIKKDSGAESVDLRIALNLDVNGQTFNPFFDFTFDLINTPNSSDLAASADFFRLRDATSSRTLVFDGREFEFNLDFGETTENGFASFDQFHVYENESAAVNLYGSLNLLGDVAEAQTGPGGLVRGGTEVATDAGAGTESDIVFQKTGYTDPEEYLESLKEDTKILIDQVKDIQDSVKNGLDDAKDSAEDAIKDFEKGKLATGDAFLSDAQTLYAAALPRLNEAKSRLFDAVANRMIAEEIAFAYAENVEYDKLDDRSEDVAKESDHVEDEYAKLDETFQEVADLIAEAVAVRP